MLMFTMVCKINKKWIELQGITKETWKTIYLLDSSNSTLLICCNGNADKAPEQDLWKIYEVWSLSLETPSLYYC